MSLLHRITTLSYGQSYWMARLNSGRILCELDPCAWLESLIASGDLAKVVEVVLCTPAGDVRVPVIRPYGAFQLNQGVANLFTGARTKTAQIVGSITNDEGDCVAAVWDARLQKLYPEMHTNVLDFSSWHPSVSPLRRLNIEALGVRL
jgi:hypothetical protein